jgi:S-DNA-T family DNA segregation ATPase FtsK/SpoIIIE
MTWGLPDEHLLTRSAASQQAEDRSAELLDVLARLGAPCNLEENPRVAPQLCRYELAPAKGVRMRDFRGLEPDVMQALGVESVRIDAPTPGRRTVGVEIPRRERATVYLGDVLAAAQTPLRAAVGMDSAGAPLVLDLASYPHTLVAGRSGGGKTVLLHAVVASLLATHTPDELEMVLVDVKQVEFSRWEGAPHVSHVVYRADRAIDVLWGMATRMDEVYGYMRQRGCRSLDELNTLLIGEGEPPVPRRLLICDELADLMMTGRGRVESAVVRLGQLGRAAGFHLVLATQSPRAQVCTGLIKANLTARVALATASALDSRIVLDQNGAESLLGRGDALIDDGQSGILRRFQTAWTSREDIDSLVEWWQAQEREEIAA